MPPSDSANNQWRPQFSLPVQSGSDLTPGDLKPKGFQEWLGELPLIHTDAAAQQLMVRLRAFNQTAIAADAREALLEQARDTLTQLNTTLEQRLLDLPYPLDEKHRRQALLHHGLLAELSTGYKRIVHDLQPAQNAQTNDLLHRALFRAMQYSGYLFLGLWQCYMAQPQQLWLELHQLHLEALRHRLHDKEIDPIFADQPGIPSLGDFYQALLLLAAAQPASLRPREIRQAWEEVCRLQDMAELGSIPAQQSIDSGFIIDIGSGRAPVHHSLVRQAAPRCRLLQTRLIGEEIHADLISLDISRPSDMQRYILARHLYRSWSHRPKRRFQRSDASEPLQLMVGLEQACHLARDWEASQDNWMDKVMGELDSLEESLWQLPDLEEETPASKAIYEKPQNTPAHPNSRQILKSEREDSWALNAPSYDLQNTEIVDNKAAPEIFCYSKNHSANGYGILLENPEQAQIKVGEITAIKNGDTGRPIGIGSIRWIRDNGQDTLHIGLEMLAPQASTVTCTSQSSSARQYNALILPGSEAQQQPNSLILPAMSFQVGDKLLITKEEMETPIKLGKAMEYTSTYSRYEYQELGSARKKRRRPGAISNETDNNPLGNSANWKIL